jgi:hypothetical protein
MTIEQRLESIELELGEIHLAVLDLKRSDEWQTKKLRSITSRTARQVSIVVSVLANLGLALLHAWRH